MKLRGARVHAHQWVFRLDGENHPWFIWFWKYLLYCHNKFTHGIYTHRDYLVKQDTIAFLYIR